MRRTTKIAAAAVAILLTAAGTACTKKNVEPAPAPGGTQSTAAGNANFKIAFVPKLQGIPYFEAMNEGGYSLGGEQSGHIVMTDYATTGDGLIAGLQFLAAMADSGELASDLVAQFEPVPQMLKNVRYQAGADPLSQDSVRAEIARAEARLSGSGRVLIRKSGTEPLIRVMAEAEDEVVLREVVDGIVAAVEQAA